MSVSLNPKADDAVAAFAADCGREIYKMQSACETYLQQYLAKYQVEQELMIAALRVGVPKRIAAHPGQTGYDDYLSELADKFAAAAHTDREAATWAVGAWAYALGKPAGFVAPVVEETPRAGRVYYDPFQKDENKTAWTLMTLIVVGGGFLGGAIGGGLLPAIMLALDAAEAVDMGDMGYKGRNAVTASALVVLMVMGAAGSLSAVATLGGWLFGGGDEKPWATFSVAFGTALSTLLILMFIPCIPLLAKPVIYFGSVFAATFKSAARGGNY